MKESTQAKASRREDGVDRISSLPDAILELILSQIPTTEEASRTSILSRRWRYLWTSLPSIDIDYERGMKASQHESDCNRFRKFVNWVLANKPLILDSFILRCGSFSDFSSIGQWIDAAVMRKVKLIDLMLPVRFGIFELPHCLVTCGSLDVLKLGLFGRDLSSPKVTGFLALRVLELKRVDLYDDNSVVKYFLESCPLLEDLSLVDCRADKVVISCLKLKFLKIDASGYIWTSLELCCPKLEFLRLTSSVAYEYLFESLYSLKKAVILATGGCDVNPSSDFFDSISHVEYLSISLGCITRFYDPDGDYPIISLPNLKALEITIDYMEIKDLGIKVVISFLKCLPDLESLHLIILKRGDLFDELDLEEAETINILTRHLKKVEFIDFNEEKPKLDLARMLLAHGNELEEMVFSWGVEAKFHERSVAIRSQFLNIHKASSIVKPTVVFNPTEDDWQSSSSPSSSSPSSSSSSPSSTSATGVLEIENFQLPSIEPNTNSTGSSRLHTYTGNTETTTLPSEFTTTEHAEATTSSNED